MQKELDTHGDIVFVRDKTNYKSILYKTFYVLEYAVQHYDCDFVLKTDDDAFVNVPPMVSMLRVWSPGDNANLVTACWQPLMPHSHCARAPTAGMSACTLAAWPKTVRSCCSQGTSGTTSSSTTTLG